METIERPDNWEGRPYAREDGWTDDHRAFRDWLMNELVLAGCEVRTLSPMGMAQVTVEHMVRQGWIAAQSAADLVRLRAAGVDPRMLRWCSWPGCLASFDASTGPEGGGWMQYRHMAVLLCPQHKDTGHWPSYDMDRDDLTKLLARCGCGETAEVRPSSWEAVFAWWEQHLAERGLAGSGRS